MKERTDRQLLRLLHHRYRPRTLKTVSFICEKFIFKGCFTGMEIVGFEEIRKKVAAGKRLIFIPEHESEYDWLILQSVLFRAGIRTAIQAGDNLFIGPLDPVLRECGAFMSVREEHKFYSRHWISNLMLRYLGKKPVVIDKDRYSQLYIQQLKLILGREGLNLLVFPGYETDPYSGAVKYGRSYSGEFNPLSPYVFIMVSKALREQGITDAEYIPVNVIYERVPEDILFRDFKAKTKKKKIAKYIYDHYYTFFKAPFSKELHQLKSRVCVSFGGGIPVHFDTRARDFAEKVRFQVSRLQRVYASMIIFYSLNNKFIISKGELRNNIRDNFEKLKARNIDCSPLLSQHGRLLSLDAMLNRVEKLFNFPQSPIIPLKSYLTLEHDRNEVFIHHPHLAAYYGNKLKYILESS
jgi:hypothetical protein